MKYAIDFSIFDSPTHAYGNVTGDLELPASPVIGQEVTLDKTIRKIVSLTTGFGDGTSYVVGLEDVVLRSKREAEVLAKRLETELGLFCVRYDEIELRPETEHLGR